MHERAVIAEMNITHNFSGFQQSFLLNGISYNPNIQVISLEAGVRASLDWKEVEKEAFQAIENGRMILWEFELGLFTELPAPFSDEGQLQALKLSLEHFRKTVWSSFKSSTIGAIIYKGTADFSAQFPWNVEEEIRYQAWLENDLDTPFLRRLFCQQICFDYLNFLFPSLPEDLLPFLFLDAQGLSFADFLSLTSRERFPHANLAITSDYFDQYSLILPSLRWKQEKVMQQPSQRVHLGVCLPSAQCRNEKVWNTAANALKELNTPFLVMTETHFPHEWDGIDEVIVFTEGISMQGRRKLNGFKAAGGWVREVQ